MSPRKPDNGPSPGSDERELDGLQQAYRALGAEQPPELLDLAVLNRARAELERPRRAWPWTLGWYHGLGTAAGVLLAVAVFFQLREELPKTPEPIQFKRDQASEALQSAPAPGSVGATESAANQPLTGGDLKQEAPARQVLAKDQPEADGDDGASTAPPPPRMELPLPPAPPAEPSAQAVDPSATEFFEDRAAKTLGDEESLDDLAPESRASEPSRRPAGARERQSEAEEKEHDHRGDLQQAVMAPGPWLEQLAEFREAGDEVAFRRGLVAFIEAYPDYPLPEGWRE